MPTEVSTPGLNSNSPQADSFLLRSFLFFYLQEASMNVRENERIPQLQKAIKTKNMLLLSAFFCVFFVDHRAHAPYVDLYVKIDSFFWEAKMKLSQRTEKMNDTTGIFITLRKRRRTTEKVRKKEIGCLISFYVTGSAELTLISRAQATPGARANKN